MMSPGNAPEPTRYKPRAYRSGGGIATGVLLLAVGAWLVGDAVLYGDGRAPWLALAGLLLGAPLVIAFTLRPAAFAGDDRLVVRNPFRTVTVPWAQVEEIRLGYSTEVVAGGSKYVVWAIPVSLRQRKRAARQESRAAAPEDPFMARPSILPRPSQTPQQPYADTAVEELRDLAERHRKSEGADGEVSARWAFEVAAPSLAGALVLAVLLATG